MTNAEFISAYMPLREQLYRVAFHLLEADAGAQDAVQDLYVKLWDSRDALDGIKNPLAYSITVLRNICLDRIRRESHTQTGEIPQMSDDSPDAEEKLEEKERLSKVIAAMDKLSRTQREVLRMRVFEDMSYEEMAERTGMNNLVLRVTLSTARRKLKSII